MPELIPLESEQLRVAVTPDLGGSVVACLGKVRGQWTPLMRQTKPEWLAAKNVSLMASFLLAPYSNRIPHAQLQFEGQTYPLQPTTPEGHTLHGVVRHAAWSVTNREADRVTLMFDSRDVPNLNWPFPFMALVRYSVGGNVFETAFTLTNTGPTPMPGGFGFHPYFNRHLTERDAVELQFNARGVFTDLIPTRAADPLPADKDFSARRFLPPDSLDHCFAGWDGQAEIYWPKANVRLRVECDAPLGHLILYTPPGDFDFAFEPVTHANNGFNLYANGLPDTGVRVLNLGQSLSAKFRLVFEAE